MDIEWIARAREGDETAFRFLVDKYKNDVHRFCFRLLQEPEEASDLAQETFITAHRKLHHYRPVGLFRSWLLTIAYRLFLNLIEKKKRRLQSASLVEEEMIYLARLNSEPIHEDTELQTLVGNALDKLDDEYRYCIVLRYQEGYSPEEIAKALSISEMAVKTRLYRGKRLFAKAISFLLKVGAKI
jgi:RNA polymerase sigma-70 factor, ECF subfamily